MTETGPIEVAHARIIRVLESGDPSIALEPEVVEEISALNDVFAANGEDPGPLLLIGWLHRLRAVARGAATGHDEEYVYSYHCFLKAFMLAEPAPPEFRLMMADHVWPIIANDYNLRFKEDTREHCQLLNTVYAFIASSTPRDHPDLERRLIALVFTERQVYEFSQDLADLDRAISYCRHTISIHSGEEPPFGKLFLLSGLLGTRWDRTGSQADLEELIAVLRQEVDAAPDQSHRAERAAALAMSLVVSFERFGGDGHITEALEGFAAADQLTEDVSASFLTAYGIAWRHRFSRSGTWDYLDTAVDLGRRAMAASKSDDERARASRELGVTLNARLERHSSVSDLNEAIEVLQDSLTGPHETADRARVCQQLASMLVRRFDRSHNPDDLEQAIAVAREAAAIAASGVLFEGAGACYSSAALALAREDDMNGTADHLDECIELHRRALDHGDPEDLKESALYRTNLASVLQRRFERNGTGADLDEAIALNREASEAFPAGTFRRAQLLNNLGASLVRRWENRHADEDTAEAVACFTESLANESAPPATRITAATLASRLLAGGEPGAAADLLEQAVDLLPEVAPQYLQRGDQEQALIPFGEIGAEAAALVLAATADPDDPAVTARALRLIEASRAVLLNQAIGIRGDLSALQAEHPELARQFIDVRSSLEEDGAPDLAARRRRQQALTALHDLITRIRARPGFAEFLLEPTTEDLLATTSDGPVVVVNTTRYRSDALLVRPEGITVVPLPGLTMDRLREHVQTFLAAVLAFRGEASYFVPEAELERMAGEELTWLWEVLGAPVLETLGWSGNSPETSPAELPHLWWAPGWYLALLPLHAMGRYDGSGRAIGTDTMLDRAVCSYTPTLRALRHAQTRRLDASTANESLIVAMPDSPPGLGPLPSVERESALLAAILPSVTMLTTASQPGQRHSQPDMANVLAELPRHSIAHFACHAYMNEGQPSRSGLVLTDWSTSPLSVEVLSRVDLDRVGLAYLSACSTADAGLTLTNEAIHVTTAFLIAGFPRVIGTLWPVDDAIATEVAQSFYLALINKYKQPDLTRTATALHSAIRAVRDKHSAVGPLLWTPFVHVGR